MYENITYEELKELPEEEKRAALLELEKVFPDKRELAEHLGVKPNVIGILFSRYVEGKRPTRQKKEGDEVIEEVSFDSNHNESTFKLTIKNNMIGEEVKTMLVGIGNTLLDSRLYSVNLTIEEKPTK